MGSIESMQCQMRIIQGIPRGGGDAIRYEKRKARNVVDERGSKVHSEDRRNVSVAKMNSCRLVGDLVFHYSSQPKDNQVDEKRGH